VTRNAAPGRTGLHLEDHARVAQPVRAWRKGRAQDRRARAARLRLGKGEEKRAILCEIARDQHIHQATLPTRGDLREARDLAPRAILDMQQASRALGDQHAALRKEPKRPRVVKLIDHLRDGQVPRARIHRVRGAAPKAQGQQNRGEAFHGYLLRYRGR